MSGKPRLVKYYNLARYIRGWRYLVYIYIIYICIYIYSIHIDSEHELYWTILLKFHFLDPWPPVKFSLMISWSISNQHGVAWRFQCFIQSLAQFHRFEMRRASEIETPGGQHIKKRKETTGTLIWCALRWLDVATEDSTNISWDAKTISRGERQRSECVLYSGDPKLNHAKPSVATGILGGKLAEGNQVTFLNPGIFHPLKQHEI